MDHDEQQLVVGQGLGQGPLKGEQLGDAQILPVGDVAILPSRSFLAFVALVADGALPWPSAKLTPTLFRLIGPRT
jgi:hypothetical protein